MGDALTRNRLLEHVGLDARRVPLKRTYLCILGIILVCSPVPCVGQTLDLPHSDPHGKQALTLHEVIHPSIILGPSISSYKWQPGGKKMTYICPTIGPRGVSTLCEYDLETHRTT